MNTLIKKNVLQFFLNNPNKRLSKSTLREKMGIPASSRNEFAIAVKELEKEGLLLSAKKKRLSFQKNQSLIIGRFYSNSRGYGFVVNPEEKKAVFIGKDAIGEALHEDLVVALITKPSVAGRNPEGNVISILKRELDTIVGTYMDSDTFGFVIPDDPHIQRDVYILKEHALNAKSYDKVVCRINVYPKENRNPEGEILEVIGVKWDKGVDLLSILKDKKIPQEFPAKVLREVEQIPDLIPESEKKFRADFTDEMIFTIDGSDAKDLDDAISIRKEANGNYLLGVHIADVAHYVKERSKLDQEALERGTSVYLVDTVIPMLPKKLSNHLCSLQPNEDKLAMSVYMEITPQGQVARYDMFESIIHSRARLTYEEVTAYLEHADPVFSERYPFLLQEIVWMKEVAEILKRKRMERGSIEFDFAEAKIILDEKGKVVDVKKYERGISNSMIEECMLVCNETVAEHFMKHNLPFVYRVHEKPREQRLKDFAEFVKQHGYVFPDVESITTKDLQKLMDETKETSQGKAIHLLLLRSMMQARYSPICKGHFGLSANFYCHFTSPIRRYPDLQIHRIMKEHLRGTLTAERKDELEKIVEESAKSSSKKERIADEAEEEYKDLKKMEYMKNKIGETYLAVITDMNNTALTVELDNTVEGKVLAHTMKGNYIFDEENLQWVCKEQNLLLGDTIVVRVKEVSLDRKEIMFDFVAL